ncbi:MAG: SRPBCC family protein [Sphingomonas sp.]|uniref:SRPBCC family protein n=1 Tax=Sphingomonas sp. TaxID=28214 RepID=UPI003563AF1D
MFEVEHVTCLSTSPLRVWTAVSDLGGFARWHPFIRLSGVASEGSAVGYTYYTTWLRKPLTAPATITRFRKPAAISWKTGLRGLMMLEETYRIDAVSSGTEIRHTTRCWGLVSILAARKMKGRILGSMKESDRALERYLRPGSPAARPLSRGDRRVAKRKSH